MARPKGIPAWNKGLKTGFLSKNPDKTRRKIGNTWRGKKRPPFSESWKKNIGLAHLGFRHSVEAKRKMSEAQKGERSYLFGKKMPKERIKKMVATRMKNGSYTAWNKGRIHLPDEKNNAWKGDKVGYYALHGWVQRKLGKPKKCSHCDLDDENRKYHWANKSGEYKRNLTDWIRLCVVCHKKYDLKRKRKKH